MSGFLSNPYVALVLGATIVLGLFLLVRYIYKIDAWLYCFAGANPTKNPIFKGYSFMIPGLLFGLVTGLFYIFASFTEASPDPAIKLVGIITLLMLSVVVFDCYKCFGVAAGTIRSIIFLSLNAALFLISLLTSYLFIAFTIGVIAFKFLKATK